MGMDKSKMNHKTDNGRTWKPTDAQVNTVMLPFLHIMCILAPSNFTWPAFWVALGLYVVTGLFGITVSYHRNLSHGSCTLPKWLEYLFAYCGAQAGQRDPIFWVSTHRHHHQLTDTKRDPHSPVHGFWFSHIGWLFNGDYVKQTYGDRKNVEDLKKQFFYRFLQRTYFWHIFGLWLLLYVIGGLPFFIWGMCVRTVLLWHATFLTNSVCHRWGNQMWNTGDLSTNNWFVTFVLFGEGWHNNHHAFEFSARAGVEWWQLDPTWYVIRFLEAIGLATNVKLPNEAHKKKKSWISAHLDNK